MINAKDFIETAEGLLFAVVEHRLEDGKALCFLRYVKDNAGWKKQTTAEANALLSRYHPDYLHYSSLLDANLHAVELTRVARHYQPRLRLQGIIDKTEPDPVEQDLADLCRLFQEQGLDIAQTGVTGSLLAGIQLDTSDIDFICYGRSVFQQCRLIVRDLIAGGRLQSLAEGDWLDSYRRRDCSLSYEDYVWHERRKFNKALINGRKFDLNLVEAVEQGQTLSYRKCGAVTLQCRVVDDTFAFDYPSVYKIDHETADSVVCFTATYTGQAFNGENVEISGMLEKTERGMQIVVGSTREAYGEYIKVIDA